MAAAIGSRLRWDERGLSRSAFRAKFWKARLEGRASRAWRAAAMASSMRPCRVHVATSAVQAATPLGDALAAARNCSTALSGEPRRA